MKPDAVPSQPPASQGQPVEVLEAGVSKGIRRKLNFISGAAVTDDAANDELEVAVSGGGGGGAHPDLATHDALGLATQAELNAHGAAADPHPTYETSAESSAKVSAHEGAADPHPTYETSAEAQGKVNAHAAAADPHPTYETSVEAQAKVDSHAAAADPHAGYQKESEKGAASGYAALDAGGTVPDAQIPAAIARDSELHGQVHDIAGADHSRAGGVAGRFMRETGATTFAFQAIPFSRGGTLFNPDGIAAGANIIVWRAPFACTVTNVRGYRVGGTGGSVNARKNGTLSLLAADLSVTAADTWMDGGAVQNAAFAAGDKLEIMVVAPAGNPTQVAVQVDFTRP